MALAVRILAQDGTSATWGFFDPKQPDVILSEGSGDIADVIEEARASKKGLASTLAKRLGVGIAVEPAPQDSAEVVVTGESLTLASPAHNPSDHYHAEFDLVPGHPHSDISANIRTVAESVKDIQSILNGHSHPFVEHTHTEYETALADAAVRAAHAATEIARAAEDIAAHKARRDIHAIPDLSPYVKVESMNAVAADVADLINRVKALEDRPLVAGHHHFLDADRRNIEEVIPELEGRVGALEKAVAPVEETEVTDAPHVHEYNTKGSHRGEWLCACGESMNTGR